MISKIKNLWTYARRPTVEFAEWKTPFEGGNLVLLSLDYKTGELDYRDHKRGVGFQRPGYRDRHGSDLAVHLFHAETRAIYSLSVATLYAFRIMDEHGFTQLWAARNGAPSPNTFKVRNHLWSHESPVSFIFGTTDGWSFIVATDTDCIEIVSRDEPAIRREQAVAEHELR